MPSKEVIALANRIQKEFGITVDPHKFYRTYAGYHQRNAGAYSWIIYLKDCCGFVGGCEPIRKYIVKRNRLDISEARHLNEFELYAYSPNEIGYDRITN